MSTKVQITGLDTNAIVKLSKKRCEELMAKIKDGDKRKVNLFGHTHLCLGVYHPYGLCVSTDLNHFRLFTEDILLGYLKRKTAYWEPDENCNFVNPFLKEVNGEIVNIKQMGNKTYKQYVDSNKF